MANYNINAVARRAVFSGSAGTGPYAFTFEVLANTDIAVFKNAVKLTLSGDYSVTINSNGTGSVTLTSAATSSDTITLIGARDIERTTDFTSGGEFRATAINDQLDSLTIFDQQLAEENKRALMAPPHDPAHVDQSGTLDMTLPVKASRAGKTLAFNATTGNPEAGPTIAATQSVADASADIETLAGISANITTVAGISSDVTSVASISSNVTSVAGNSSNINSAVSNASNINSAVSNASNINAVVADIANVNSVASNISNVNTVAGAASNINAVVANSTNINTVAGNSANINTVASNDANITAVAGDASDIGTVATNLANVNLVASNINSGVIDKVLDFGAVTDALSSTTDYGSV